MAKTKEKEKDKASGPRPRNDSYVMMLFLTFVAIVAGTVLMYLDFEEYGGKQPPKENVPALPKLGDSLKVAEPEPAPKDPMDPMDPMGKGGDPMGKGGDPPEKLP